MTTCLFFIFNVKVFKRKIIRKTTIVYGFLFGNDKILWVNKEC